MLKQTKALEIKTFGAIDFNAIICFENVIYLKNTIFTAFFLLFKKNNKS